MTEQAIEFLQDWVHDHVEHPRRKKDAPLTRQADELTRECEHDAAAVGVTPEDIAEEVGDLNELIESRLEDASDAGINKPQKKR